MLDRTSPTERSIMDLNLVVLSGRLAAPVEIRHDGAQTSARCLVAVRSEQPRRRLDVVPVTWWNPNLETLAGAAPGGRVWVAGSVQRRFWTGSPGARSRLEIVAHDVQPRTDESTYDVATGVE